MQRRTRRLVPLALAALLGCQDYNFTPASYCLIQPGTTRVTLSDISTADVLFVVDDSGSMGGEQQSLADNFGRFVQALTDTNVARVGADLLPIDFHIAITTTSVFLNNPTTAVCAASCAGASGQVCCDQVTSQPLRVARTCTGDAACGAGFTCRTDCTGYPGESVCCSGTSVALTDPVACPTLGQACGSLQTRYRFTRTAVACTSSAQCGAGFTCQTTCQGLAGSQYCCDGSGITQRLLTCAPGVGVEGGLYPQGDFVASGANPRVLHFDKDLFKDPVSGLPNQPAIDALVTRFRQNVAVGTCGSGQEQAFEAARLAMRKALRQDGLSQPGLAAGEWPHDASKLVVVMVGDEDDCSSPRDPSAGVIMTLPPAPDACENDVQQRRFRVQEYADYFGGLGRPLAGAFIVSAVGETCENDSCQAGVCCDLACSAAQGAPGQCTVAGICGGQGAGARMIELSRAFRDGKGADVVVGSICNPDFGQILERIAEIVKQPTGLVLPTQPAAGELSILRIVGRDGRTRKTCSAPAAPGLTFAEAEASGADWWFWDGNETAPPPRTTTGASRFVFINRTTRACEANPGETYSADYLGLVPAGGCDTALDCQAALGGQIADWTCERSVGAARGSCLCGG
jgi:hypothetical protein